MKLTELSATTLLSIFGVVVLLICIALIFSQRATPLRTPQKIKGFGVELEISVLTLLVLVGLLLSLSSIYIQVAGYQQQLAVAQKEADRLKTENDSTIKQLASAKRIDLTVFVSLEGVNNQSNMPKVEDLISNYYVRDQKEPLQADVSKGVEPFSIRLNLKNLTPASLIERLEVVDQKTFRTWDKINFFPLNPTYELKTAVGQ